LSLGLAILTMVPTWTLPLAVRPWERWLAVVWLLWVLPVWLIANNLDYWIVERACVPIWAGKVVWILLFILLIGLAIWGWCEIRRGRTFVTSWLPHHLKTLFLIFIWLTTVISCSKTLVARQWSSAATPVGFILLALLIHWFMKLNYKVQ